MLVKQFLGENGLSKAVLLFAVQNLSITRERELFSLLKCQQRRGLHAELCKAPGGESAASHHAQHAGMQRPLVYLRYMCKKRSGAVGISSVM